MTNVLLFLILLCLVLQNAGAWYGWLRVNLRYWRKRRRLLKQERMARQYERDARG